MGQVNAPWLQRLMSESSGSFRGLSGSSLAWVLARLLKESSKPIVLWMGTSKEVQALADELEFFLGGKSRLLLFPPHGILPYYGLSPSPEAVASRMSFLHQLLTRRDPYLALVPLTATQRRLPPKEIFNQYSDYVVVGEEISREALLRKMVESGYQNVPVVEDPGTFSSRGGILDIYSPQMEKPVRLEFFGDLLETLRSFDPESQRSLEAIQDFVLLPAREIPFSEETLAKASLGFRERANEAGLGKEEREAFLTSLKQRLAPPSLETYLPLFYPSLDDFFSYLPKKLINIFWEPELGRQHYENLWEETIQAHDACKSLERIIQPEHLMLPWSEWERRHSEVESWSGRLLGSAQDELSFHPHGHEEMIARIRSAPLGEGMLEPLLQNLREWRDQGIQPVLTAGTHSQGLRLKDLLERAEIPVSWGEGHFLDVITQVRESKPEVKLWEGHVGKGFVWDEERVALLTDQEIFGEKKRRKKEERRAMPSVTSFEDLAEGDYVVHEEHGLGIYRGLVSLQVGAYPGDFLLLEYLGGDKLYLPVYRLNLVSRYTGPDGHVPRLDRMGSGQWEKNKGKVKQALRSIAGELLKLYAERASSPGYAFSPTGTLYEEFEATFPFEETRDQLHAIEEINRDMDADRPMDRLVCGDVGFGKTEVAMRAAFRALLDNKQVAVLVPTTVLALQHERTFRNRFAHYPAMIESISRFSNPKQQKEILERLKAGKVDIIIGTHALLSERIRFKDLGLLIVDEEHRFGVKQKEKIKMFKAHTDVLTLTATPIPRTLNMALSGIRDLSVIATPPTDRLAVQTLVATYNEGLIREAVHRELSRGGQVYFVHNRVQSLPQLKRRLMEILPEAKIEMAHGQMEEKELEEVMIKFLNREFNLLLCTTLVESGLDIPSANTMIINRADTFGLAQLYQLRGRIGRSNLRAFAYLLIPGQELITTKARARLAVLQRYTDLGSGFRIASHDLEIRGSGNLLGPEQSGQIAAVGYDLYMRLMEEALMEVKGETRQQAPDPELKLQVHAAIPEDYMPDTPMRLTLYKRLASAVDEEELSSLTEETQDRFGQLPQPLENLLKVMRLKLLAKRVWLKSLVQEARQMVLVFSPDSPVEPQSLMLRLQKEPERFRWLKPHELAVHFKEGKGDVAIEGVMQFLSSLELADSL